MRYHSGPQLKVYLSVKLCNVSRHTAAEMTGLVVCLSGCCRCAQVLHVAFISLKNAKGFDGPCPPTHYLFRDGVRVVTSCCQLCSYLGFLPWQFHRHARTKSRTDNIRRTPTMRAAARGVKAHPLGPETDEDRVSHVLILSSRGPIFPLVRQGAHPASSRGLDGIQGYPYLYLYPEPRLPTPRSLPRFSIRHMRILNGRYPCREGGTYRLRPNPLERSCLAAPLTLLRYLPLARNFKHT